MNIIFLFNKKRKLRKSKRHYVDVFMYPVSTSVADQQRLNPRGCDTHPSLCEKRPHQRQSWSMQNAWRRRRVLPCSSLAFYRASRGLLTRTSRLGIPSRVRIRFTRCH